VYHFYQQKKLDGNGGIKIKESDNFFPHLVSCLGCHSFKSLTYDIPSRRSFGFA